MANDVGLTEADRTLNNQIRSAWKADSSISDATKQVTLRSDNGVVTLNGTVATEKEKQDLESRVERLAGVKEVENNLQISPGTSSSSSGGLSSGGMSSGGSSSTSSTSGSPATR